MWRHDVLALGRAAERIAAQRIKVKGAGAMARVVRRTAGRWRIVLDWRTCMGHDTAVRNLELLRVALIPLGWRCVGLYDRQEFRCPVPLLWVYWDGAAEKVWAVVTVRAVPGGMWAYFETGDGRGGFVAPCGNAKGAATALDLILKHRMSPTRQWGRP
ncbi:hypothetical protein [Actinomadura formosensis]|uniref:hypothetical protein n=1 Tax=Actinomadura formosensis TaxID=60706 RepID=UPI003D90E524